MAVGADEAGGSAGESRAAASIRSVVGAVARGGRALHWYVRELLGESAYDRYCERHRREHPDHAPVPARQFWRDRADAQATAPRGGCC